MKLLIWYCDSFGYTPSIRTLENADPDPAEYLVRDVVVGFIQAEEKDMEDASGVEKKVLKNLKWAAGKNGTRKVVLHSFAHLSESKASPEFTVDLLSRLEERLKAAEYEVAQTPFGWFLDLRMDAPGKPLARIFKDL